MRIACPVIGGRERRGHPCGPAVEKGLHVRRAEAIAGGLQRRRGGTREKSVVETVKRDARAPELLFHPLVPVETQLDRIRQIGRTSERPDPTRGPARRSSND